MASLPAAVRALPLEAVKAPRAAARPPRLADAGLCRGAGAIVANVLISGGGCRGEKRSDKRIVDLTGGSEAPILLEARHRGPGLSAGHAIDWPGFEAKLVQCLLDSADGLAFTPGGAARSRQCRTVLDLGRPVRLWRQHEFQIERDQFAWRQFGTILTT